MTKEEIRKNNILIAKFMGGKVTLIRSHTPNVKFDKHPRQDRNFNSNSMHVNKLMYHNSFDWIMPVVEKIHKITNIFEIRHNIFAIKGNMPYFHGETTLEAIYKGVIEFIKLENDSKRNN